MNILGVNAFNHDPSAVLISDGLLVAAVEEEKVSRQKNIVDFPGRAIMECLDIGGIQPEQINAVAIPRVHSKEIVNQAFHLLRYFPDTWNLFRPDSAVLASNIKKQRYLKQKNIIREYLHPAVKIFHVPHHLAHAVAVSDQSGFDRSLIVVMDGIAEYDTIWIGELTPEGGIIKHRTNAFPHSLGMIYAAFTQLLGFTPFNDEWKVMGMAAYGAPKYYEEINRLISVKHDLSVNLDLSFFQFHSHGKNKWFSDRFPLHHLARLPSDELGQEHFDLAASFQAVFEEKLMDFFGILKKKYPAHSNLCLSGGVFFNCLFNGKLSERKLFEKVYVDCHPGDAGSAAGAASYIYQKKTGQHISPIGHSSFLGREFTVEQIKSALELSGLTFRKYSSIDEVAKMVSEGKVIGFFQGRAEFGARALGARSIVADPRNPSMKDRINSSVKYRESFRPFAPSVLHEDQELFFSSNVFSPYMSFAVTAKKGTQEKAPAVIHNDNTARIQSVIRETNPIYYDLIKSFKEITGIPFVLNTSFNIKGEPIVYTPEEAIKTFKRAQLDALVIGPYIAEG